MHSIKAIRENPDFFKKKIEERNTKLNIDDLLTLDKKIEKLHKKKKNLNKKKKLFLKAKMRISLKSQKKSPKK